MSDKVEVDFEHMSDACLGRLFRVAYKCARTHKNRGGTKMKSMCLYDLESPRFALQRFILKHGNEVLFKKYFGEGSIQNPFNKS